MAADGVGCDEDAFEQGVRVALQDITVLEGSGFAFVRIDDQIFWFGSLLRNEGPFSTR